MKLLNIGCGSVRPKEPWMNLDSLREQLKEGTPERWNLDTETNYVDHRLDESPLPFVENTFDGILCSHVIEHFDCQLSWKVLSECHRVLKPGGILVTSVPNAEYFLQVHAFDKPEEAERLFGEPICPAEPWHKSFFDYALFYWQHKQLLTRPAMECLLLKAGFRVIFALSGNIFAKDSEQQQIVAQIEPLMNRRKFSLEMIAVKESSARE